MLNFPDGLNSFGIETWTKSSGVEMFGVDSTLLFISLTIGSDSSSNSVIGQDPHLVGAIFTSNLPEFIIAIVTWRQ
jgi:hypothetical protein